MISTNKGKLLSLFLSVVACLSLGFLLNSSMNKTNEAKVALNKAHSEYRSLGKVDVKQVLGTQTVSESNDVVQAKDKVQQFATTYFTYKSSKEYVDRQNDLAGVIKLSDDDTNALFDPDNQGAQIDRINNLSLRSTFKSVMTSTATLKSTSNIDLVSVVSVEAGSDDLGTKSQKVVIHSIYDTNSKYLTSVQVNQLI